MLNAYESAIQSAKKFLNIGQPAQSAPMPVVQSYLPHPSTPAAPIAPPKMASYSNILANYMNGVQKTFSSFMGNAGNAINNIPAVKSYTQQVQESKQTPFFNANNTPQQWIGKVGQDIQKRGLAEGFHDITYPITTSPYLRPITDMGTSAVRMANYKLGRPSPTVNYLLGQTDKQMANPNIKPIPDAIRKTLDNILKTATPDMKDVAKGFQGQQSAASKTLGGQNYPAIPTTYAPKNTAQKFGAFMNDFIGTGVAMGPGIAASTNEGLQGLGAVANASPTVARFSQFISDLSKTKIKLPISDIQDVMTGKASPEVVQKYTQATAGMNNDEIAALVRQAKVDGVSPKMNILDYAKDLFQRVKISLQDTGEPKMLPSGMPEPAPAYNPNEAGFFRFDPTTNPQIIDNPDAKLVGTLIQKMEGTQPLSMEEGNIITQLAGKYGVKIQEKINPNLDILRQLEGLLTKDQGIANRFPNQGGFIKPDEILKSVGLLKEKPPVKPVSVPQDIIPPEVKTVPTSVNPEASKLPLKTPTTQSQVSPNQIVPEVKPEVPLADSSPLYFNTDRLNVNTKAKDFVTQTIEEVKPQIEQVAGKKLSNKEAVDLANNSAGVLNRVVSKQETLAWEAKLLKARELLAKQAKDGKVTQEYIDNLIAVKTQGTDIARKLQSMSIGADPKEVTAKQAILEAVLRVTQNSDEVLSKAKGVDFNNYEQAASFYRQFVKPTASDWLEKVRYSSMLSSPNTHINNTSSNFQGTGIIAPIEKTISGNVDALLSAINPNRVRTQFAGEGVAYAKGYYSKLGDAWTNFTDTMSGKKISSAQEMYNLPLTEKGTFKRGVENLLSVPGKLLQAEDEFFQTLTEGGVKSSLKFRESKGVKVGGLEDKAYLEARKRLFNAAFGLKEEGYVLKALEFIPMKVAEARMNSNPVISTIAKYTFPFVRVPSNILKSSVEYGPLGVTTLPGASDKVGQLSKAILGTAIGLAAAVLVGEDRLTWGEPTDEKKRNAARAAGWQPYSLKIGDNYFSYAKMHPAIAFPLALVAAVRDSQKKKLLDDGQVETVLDGVAKWVNFYASMSYVKNIGDAVSGVNGDLSAGTRQISNYAQQLVPYRALLGWVTRIVDPYQRQVDPKGNILTKQLQSLMTQVPGLSGAVPARVDAKGNPIENPHRWINAFSPVRITTENPQLMKTYNLLEAKAQTTRQETAIKQQVLDTGKEQTYNGKKFYPSKELDTATGEYKPVVKSVKVPQTTSDVYGGLDKKYETSPDAPQNILQTIGVYGTGILKDPSGTINAIKTGQPIRKVTGDTVVVERLKGLSALDQGDQSTQVDHIIADSLGGDNSESNLAIISTQDNQAKGVVDTYLYNLLKDGKITKKEAQTRDLNWRNEITNLSSTDKTKVSNILSATPPPAKVVKTDILSTLAGRTYQPIYNNDTGTYSDIQVKMPQQPVYTGMTELDKQLKSKYTTALTTAKTNIGKLYLDGQITAQEANDALTTIKLTTGKAKKPAKMAYKKLTLPKPKKLAKFKIKGVKLAKYKPVGKLAKSKAPKKLAKAKFKSVRPLTLSQVTPRRA
jgi:hypothetical protein